MEIQIVLPIKTSGVKTKLRVIHSVILTNGWQRRRKLKEGRTRERRGLSLQMLTNPKGRRTLMAKRKPGSK